MNITLDANGYYIVEFKYRPAIVEAIKKVNGKRWDTERKVWKVPSSERASLDRFVAYASRIDTVVWGGAKPDREVTFVQPEMPELTIPHNLKIEPYPYQKKGIARGLQLKSYINGDEPGLGKTLQSIGTVYAANQFPCLVICPSSLKENWKREWERFTDKKAMILSDNVKDTWPFFHNTGLNDVFIVNFESLKKYFVLKITKKDRWTLRDVRFKDTINIFKSVIIDESHRVKSTSTQQTKFCKGITTGKEYVILLTGTPVVNKPKDLVAQLGIINKIEKFGGYQGFTRDYCSGPNEASNLKELNAMLWQHCFFRREKSKVLLDLPDKTRQILSCEITNRKEYQDAEKDLISYLRQYKEATDEKIAKSLRGEVMVRIGILKNISARGKIKEVVEFVNDFRESKEKIVIFCSLHEIVDKLLEIYPKAVCVTGRENAQQKQFAIDSFQHKPECDIIICSIKAAGVGLTLTASSNVVFVEFPWTDADCIQCEDRTHRIGQKNAVTASYFLGKNTIDEKIYKIIQLKRTISNAVMGSEEQIPENIVDMIAKMFDGDEPDGE